MELKIGTVTVYDVTGYTTLPGMNGDFSPPSIFLICMDMESRYCRFQKIFPNAAPVYFQKLSVRRRRCPCGLYRDEAGREFYNPYPRYGYGFDTPLPFISLAVLLYTREKRRMKVSRMTVEWALNAFPFCILLKFLCYPWNALCPFACRFYDDMAEVNDDDEEDYDEPTRANANELSAMERQVEGDFFFLLCSRKALVCLCDGTLFNTRTVYKVLYLSSYARFSWTLIGQWF